MIHLLGFYVTFSSSGKSSYVIINTVEYKPEKKGDLYTQSQKKTLVGQALKLFVNVSL